MNTNIAFSFAIVAAVEGAVKTIHPGAVDEADRAMLIAIAERAVAKRLRVEQAIREDDLREPDPIPSPAPKAPPPIETMTQGEIARTQGYTGDCCDNCGEFRMKRNGSCMSCDACGTTTGCS